MSVTHITNIISSPNDDPNTFFHPYRVETHLSAQLTTYLLDYIILTITFIHPMKIKKSNSILYLEMKIGLVYNQGYMC